LNSPLHTRIQTAVKTVDRSRLFSAKEDKVVTISRKDHGIGVWDAEGILFIGYLEKGKTITGKYYCNLLTRLDEKLREKILGLQKKNHLSQCARAQKCFGNGKSKRSALRIFGTSTLFPRFGFL
jgi:hypothetical protein